MASLQNKCPLCGKVNPVTEWVCEDCGARLAFSGLPTASEQGQSQTPLQLKTAGDEVAPKIAVPVFVVLGILSGLAHYFYPTPKYVRLKEGISTVLEAPEGAIPVGKVEATIFVLLLATVLSRKLIPQWLSYFGGSCGLANSTQRSDQKRGFDQG